MFYCLKDIDSDNKQFGINKPYRIIRSHTELFYIDEQKCKGHNTIKELKKECSTWRKYHSQDPVSANKICEDNFVFKSTHLIFTPMDEEFNKVSYKLIKHTVFGELDKKIHGIHLISKLNKNIKNVSVVKPKDKNGVWVAHVDFYSDIRKKPYTKENSSMFPIHWTPNDFMFKIYYAYKRKKQCKKDKSIFHSITDCGIRVDFVIKNNELKSVYPIYEEY